METQNKENLIRLSINFGLKNIWRNKVLSVATISVMTVILFIFNVIISINILTHNAISSLNEKIDITVYFKDSTEYQESQAIVSEIERLPEVKEVTYKSKEQALSEFAANEPKLADSFQRFEIPNPLPASLKIITRQPEDHETIAALLQEDRFLAYLKEVDSGQNNESRLAQVSNKLLTITTYTEKVIFWVMVAFILGGILVIVNALKITIYDRRKEIEIMELVGSPLWFIRAPFLVEALVYSIIATFISTLMFAVLTGTFLFGLLIAELIATTILALISAILATEKHLKPRT